MLRFPANLRHATADANIQAPDAGQLAEQSLSQVVRSTTSGLYCSLFKASNSTASIVELPLTQTTAGPATPHGRPATFVPIDLLIRTLSILNTEIPLPAANLAVALSRNAMARQKNTLSQLYSAKSINELPSLEDLKNTISTATAFQNTIAGFCAQFIEPLLATTAITPTEQANKSQKLNKLAGLSTVLLSPLRANNDLHTVDTATLHNLLKLFNKLPSTEMQILKAECQAAIRKQDAIALVNQPGFDFRTASNELKSNAEVVWATVQQNGQALYYASDELKNNPEVVLAAVQQNGQALYYASDELKNNTEVVLAAVQQTGWALEYASVALKNNPKVVLAAIQRHRGSHLQHSPTRQYANYEIQNNTVVVLAAILQRGLMLQYASDELKNNLEVVLAAVREQGWALQYASNQLKNNPEVVLAAVQQEGVALQFASDEIKNNPQVVLAAVQKQGWALQYASDEVKNNTEVVLAAVQKNGWALGYASDELKNNPEVRLAVKAHYKF